MEASSTQPSLLPHHQGISVGKQSQGYFYFLRFQVQHEEMWKYGYKTDVC